MDITTYPEKPKRGHKPKRKNRSETGQHNSLNKMLGLTIIVPTMVILAIMAILINAFPDFELRSSERAVYEARIAEFSAILAEQPDAVNTYIDRGFAYRSLGEYDKAIADFEKAIELDGPGKYFRPLVGLGMVQESLKNYEAALDYHNQALAVQLNLGNSAADPYYRLGNVQDLLGNTELAMENYRQSIEADPDYPNGYMGLANLLYEADRAAEALENYERYIDIQGADSYSYILKRVAKLRDQLDIFEH